MPGPLDELRDYAKKRAKRDQLILDAREAGATWDEIAEAAGISRAAAFNAANAQRQRNAHQSRE